MAAETQYTANTGMVQISTANSNLDGSTGVYSGTIITGGSNGTVVKRVIVKGAAAASTGVPSQGMVRLFINTKLILEIPIKPTTQSATDTTFEAIVEVNFKLQSGDTMKASTEKGAAGDVFNVIVEALDWTYFSGSVRPESTNFTANTGMVVISTANASALDGTGSSTLITASNTGGSKGLRIESITITATAFNTGSATTDGMIRFFLYDGTSSTKLIHEERVTAVTQSGTLKTFHRRIPLPNFELKAGWSVKVSSEVADTFVIVAEGNDWNYPAATYVSNFTPASGTSVATEELLHSLQVPANMLASGDLFEVYASLARTNNANNITWRIYVNTSNTLTAATKIATYTNASVASDIISRYFPIVSDTALDVYGAAATSIETQYGSTTGATANVTVPSVSAGFWVLISAQKATAGDTDTVRASFVNKLF